MLAILSRVAFDKVTGDAASELVGEVWAKVAAQSAQAARVANFRHMALA